MPAKFPTQNASNKIPMIWFELPKVAKFIFSVGILWMSFTHIGKQITEKCDPHEIQLALHDCCYTDKNEYNLDSIKDFIWLDIKFGKRGYVVGWLP